MISLKNTIDNVIVILMTSSS